MALVRDLDRAVGNGLIKITKFASGMIKELSTNEYKLKDSDGTKTSAGIRVENTTNNRFFAFSIESENTGYFKSATTLETLGSNSTVTFVLGPGLKFEIDIDSEHKGLDVCYIESSYRTGDLMPDGTIVYADWATDWNTAHDDEVYIKFLGEVTRADLPTKDFALSAGYEGGIGDFILNEIGGRVVGYDEGRTHTTLERYNTVKIQKHPLLPTPTLVRELIPGFPVEYGFTLSQGSISEGEGTSLFPGDSGGEVVSISQNIPSFLYPYTRSDGGRFTVMDLADTDTPELLKAGGLLERGAGNTVDKLGDLPYFRYWGDAVLMTPIVVAGLGTGVVLFFTVPIVGSSNFAGAEGCWEECSCVASTNWKRCNARFGFGWSSIGRRTKRIQAGNELTLFCQKNPATVLHRCREMLRHKAQWRKAWRASTLKKCLKWQLNTVLNHC